MDTSAIEANQSCDYDEFDDVLNTLDRGFKQRKENGKMKMYRSNGNPIPYN